MSVTIASTLLKSAPSTNADNQSSKPVESDNSAVGQDFASLLLSQLAPITQETLAPEALAKPTTQADLPEADATPLDAASLFASLGLIQQEPGLARNSDAKGTDSDLPGTNKDDKTTLDPLLAVQAVPVKSDLNLTAGLSVTPESKAGAITAAPTVTIALNVKQDSKTQPVTTDSQSTAGLSMKQDGKTDFDTTAPKLDIAPSEKENIKTESVTAEPKLAGSLAADDKPAKFAVPALFEQSKEASITKSLSSDPLPNNLSALTNNVPAHSNRTMPSSEASLSVSTPVRDQNWGADFGQKIVWLANNDKQAAQLTLNPPQMGPIDISLNIDKGNATATFVSANADVREAIETAMPRLREMFAHAGIELGQTNVSAESFKQHAGNENWGRSASPWMNDNAILVADSAGPLPAKAFFAQQGNGMVDIFA